MLNRTSKALYTFTVLLIDFLQICFESWLSIHTCHFCFSLSITFQITFSGAGTTLSGRAPRPRTPPPVKEEDDDIQMMGQTLGGGGGGGGGRTLGNSGGGSSGALKRKKTGGKSLNERDVEMEEVIELD